MPPNSGDVNVAVKDDGDLLKNKTQVKTKEKSTWIFMRKDIRWQTTIILAIVHLAALYGVLTFPYIQKWKTILWAYFVCMYTMFGINGGVHRYWCHKSYKAKIPLRIVLAFCYLTAAQVSFKKWVLHHRLHHRFMDTDADPHNAKRGFFFSHIGWLMVDKTPEAAKKQREIDLSDMQADPVIRFADKHFFVLCMLVQAFSVLVPVYCWGEDWHTAIMSQIMRYVYTLNAMFSINSVAHTYGYRPYDKSIAPVENRWASYVSFGEGWHNYHHVFPWDYRTPEIGGPRFDVVANLITMFSWIGWAYDLKRPSDHLIKKTMQRKGDGTFLENEES